jgi:hypothetical protein
LRQPSLFAVLLVLLFRPSGAPALLRASPVQDDGQNGAAAGIVQLFGEGNELSGVVTLSQPGDFTVRTSGGDTYRVLWSPNTRFMKDRQPIEAKAVRVGDTLVAAGLVDKKAKTVGAVFLYDLDPAEARQAYAGFGKTWMAGKVTGIHGLRITIARPDNQKAEILAVDENTSFRQRGESVTLADVKAGDFISVEGEVRDNTFFARVLRLVDPNSEPNSGPNSQTNLGGRGGPPYF